MARIAREADFGGVRLGDEVRVVAGDRRPRHAVEVRVGLRRGGPHQRGPGGETTSECELSYEGGVHCVDLSHWPVHPAGWHESKICASARDAGLASVRDRLTRDVARPWRDA